MASRTILQSAVAYNAADLNGQAVETTNATAMLVWFTPTGSYNGSAIFEVSPDDGATWFPIDGRLISTVETPTNTVASPAATDLYVVSVPTYCMFRVRMSGGSQGGLTVRAAPSHYAGL